MTETAWDRDPEQSVPGLSLPELSQPDECCMTWSILQIPPTSLLAGEEAPKECLEIPSGLVKNQFV